MVLQASPLRKKCRSQRIISCDILFCDISCLLKGIRQPCAQDKDLLHVEKGQATNSDSAGIYYNTLYPSVYRNKNGLYLIVRCTICVLFSVVCIYCD